MNSVFVLPAFQNNAYFCTRKKPKNEHGFRIYHDIEEDIHLVGYIREEKDTVVFTTPGNRVMVINNSMRL